MKINPFGRRTSALPFPALLANYLARAQALADAGGGNLWVIEPSLPVDMLTDFTEAVARHLSEHGIANGGINTLEGTTSARIIVLAPTLDRPPTQQSPEVVLPQSELSPPATR